MRLRPVGLGPALAGARSHPFASAIDTELPVPPDRVHIMLANAPAWCQPDIAKNDHPFDAYPTESISGWHEARGLTVK